MDMDNWEQKSEKKPVPNNRDMCVVKAKNAITGEIMFMPKYKLNEFNHRIDTDGTIIYIPEKIPDKSRGERGCLIFILLFLASLATVGVVVINKEYKANKKHPNTISGMYEKDKKIIISDASTKEERIIEYNGYKDKFAKQNQLPEFEEQVKLSNIGDTVMFVSPKYDDRRKFALDAQNRLYLNKDSIIIRTQKQR